VKVAEEAVAGTVTEAGAVSTLAAVFDNVTSEPPVGAAWDRVMEQDAVPFELRVLGCTAGPIPGREPGEKQWRMQRCR
jgi:hypothetical protein